MMVFGVFQVSFSVWSKSTNCLTLCYEQRVFKSDCFTDG